MYIPRTLETQLYPFLKRKEVLAIVGPRQSGKTTLLEHLYTELEEKKQKVKFITFEKRSDLSLFEESIEDFRDICQEYTTVIIDEFQYAKEGGQKLKYLFDTSKTKFIISGSSTLELTFQTGKYMVGRMFTFTLWPFSFREHLSSRESDLFHILEKKIPSDNDNIFPISPVLSIPLNQKLQSHFENFLVWGGYPAINTAKTEEEKKKIFETIFDTYILKDIQSLLRLPTKEELIKLVTLLSAQIGNLIEYQELSNTSTLPYKNLLNHIDILKGTYIIDLIRPFFTNKRTELTKNPKVYFIDLGLRNFILSDFRKLSNRNDAGHLVENYVFNTLKRKNTILEAPHFWRTKSKAEVDFVIQRKQKIIPIEVKYSSQPTVGKSLYSFIQKFSPHHAVVLTKDTFGKEKIKTCSVSFIPVYYI